MFERNTGKVMFNMADIFLSIMFPDCKSNIIDISTHGVRNMTRRHQGDVTLLENSSLETLVQIWRDAHQIDLVMREIFSIVVKYQFILL